jgi:hypothetical protein
MFSAHYKKYRGSWHEPEKQQKCTKKCPKWTFQTLLSSKPRVYSVLHSQKRKTTTRVKDSGESAAGAAAGSAMLQRLAELQSCLERRAAKASPE